MLYTKVINHGLMSCSDVNEQFKFRRTAKFFGLPYSHTVKKMITADQITWLHVIPSVVSTELLIIEVNLN